VSGVADRAAAALDITSLFTRPCTFPAGSPYDLQLEIIAGDFAFAMDHRRIARQLRGRHLRWPLGILTRDDGQFNTVNGEECLSLGLNGNRQSPPLPALSP
jgi:hypothetical protein